MKKADKNCLSELYQRKFYSCDFLYDMNKISVSVDM